MNNYISKKIECMGTIISITLKKEDKKFFELCFKEFKNFEKKYSRFNENSYLSYLNKNKNLPIELDDETIDILKISEDIKNKSEGYFDICIKEVLDEIGYDKNYSFKKKIKLKNPFRKKGYVFDGKKIKIYSQIDFGGLGKGYITDKVKKMLINNNVTDFMLNSGGDIFTYKKNGNNQNKENKWDIYLENPENDEYVFAKISLYNESICSSSSNRRKWSNKLHHIIDPKKSNSSQSDIKGIYVVNKKTVYADAYATALFSCGFDKAIQISKKNSLNIIMISNKNKIYISDDLINKVEFY